MMTKTVVYISSCALYADGIPNTSLLQELPWLRTHFNRVLMCSAYGVAEIGEDRLEKVKVSRSTVGAIRAYLKAPFQKVFREALADMRRDHMLSVSSFSKLLTFTVRGLKLYNWILPLLREEEHTTVYAYWMSFDGFTAALCKQNHPTMRAVARGHSFDIDVQYNPLNPYLMKRFMARTLDMLYPVSRDAKEKLLSYVEIPLEKLKVVYVGSAGEITDARLSAPRFDEKIYNVVSCSRMVKIKRLPLLIDALAKWDVCPLHWTHIGGGDEEETVGAYARKKLGQHPMVTYQLKGSMPPERVRGLYQRKPFDVFVNVSKNEGTPIAIIEAMHEGIPVVAPRVGGIPELIDDSVGCLYDQDGGVDEIVGALRTIYHKTPEETSRMRATAQARWNERFAIDYLMPQIFPDEIMIHPA